MENCLAEVVKYVPSNHIDIVRNSFGFVNVIDSSARKLRVIPGSNFIRICGQKSRDLPFQISDVFVGPFDFRRNNLNASHP